MNNDFEQWWEKHGQFCRSGGGEYEKTFAFRAWEAAVSEERAGCVEVCRRRARAMRETIKNANPRTSEHLMLRRDARMEEANDCATEIIERSNVEFSGGAPLHGAASAGTKGYASGDKNE